MKQLKKLIQFLNIDIWRIRMRQLKGRRPFWINQLRILLLAIRGFDEDRCQLRASALTFYSLLSIVPILAMAFGIAKGFGFQSTLEILLLERMQGQEEVVRRIIAFAQSLLENTQGGIIAGFGVGFLIWTVIKVLGNIEISFNEIWGIPKPRSLTRKFSDYTSLMLICPLLLITSSSLTVLITSQLTLLIEKLSFLGPMGDIILWFLKLLPFAVMWVLFTFIYLFMPNTKVNFRSGLIGGIIGGTIYQIVQWIYINFQIGVSRYGAIYGSFAALPLFLMWLHISWLIVLFGAEISFAEQNVDTYEFEPDCLKASRSLKHLLALGITQLCVKSFDEGKLPPDANAIANAFEMPIRLVNVIVFELTESGILTEVKGPNGLGSGFQPARDIDDLTIAHILKKMDDRGVDAIPFLETGELKKIHESLKELAKTVENSEHNLTLNNI